MSPTSTHDVDSISTPSSHPPTLAGLTSTPRRSFTEGAQNVQLMLQNSVTTVLSDEPIRVQSDISLTRPQTHRLPTHTMWLITISIAIGMAVINNFMVYSGSKLLSLKFSVVFGMMADQGSAGLSSLVLAAISVVFCSVCAFMVVKIAPICAGSGLPEAKGYLNGNEIAELFGVRALIVRILGITLSTSAGLPVGREGPMVCIGGCLGYGVVHVLALPHVRRWVKTCEDEDVSPALIVDTERFAHAKRIGCALGGAAGIATAFNAPIGGILYMFEEVTVDCWAPELTLRAFVCTVISALVNKALLPLFGSGVHSLVIFEEGTGKSEESWNWIDVPFVAFLAVLVGVYAALFTRVLLQVFTHRRTLHKQLSRFQPWPKVAEVLIFTVVCALAWGLAPLAIGCELEPHGGDDTGAHHRRLAEGSGLVQYTCADGEYNEAASLLLAGTEGACKHLFARDNAGQFSFLSLVLSFALYSVLASGIPGLPVPMGLFVPSMFLGGLAGRLLGEAFAKLGISGLASPGVYAILGSAAMLSGFTQMSIAIVVLLVEASMDLQLIPPLMLAIFVAHSTSTKINHHGYDEVLILKKGVPYLDPELPHEMERNTAGDLCDELKGEALLAPTETFENVGKALNYDDVFDFPVISDGVCIGVVPRARLEAALLARSMWLLQNGRIKAEQAPHLSSVPESAEACSEDWSPTGTITHYNSKLELGRHDKMTYMESHVKNIFQKARTDSLRLHDPVLHVHRIMDKVPHLILEDMPVARFYNIFTKTGCHSAVVVTAMGAFCGILTRECLISSTRDAHRPERCRRNNSGGDPRKSPSSDSIGSKPSRGMSGSASPRLSPASNNSWTMMPANGTVLADSPASSAVIRNSAPVLAKEDSSISMSECVMAQDGFIDLDV